MRGRTSVSPLNKIGLCIAKNSNDKIIITPLGKYVLSDEFDLGNLLFNHFLKWQLPNPDSKAFSLNDGFSIKPFIGTLHLINEVNKLWSDLGNKPVGINKDEFSLFVPTLIHYKNITKQAKELIQYRILLNSQKNNEEKREIREDYRKKFAQQFLENDSVDKINKLLKNLDDYCDSTIRYFRLTRYIYIRGGGYYVDLEPRRTIEIQKLLETDNASPKSFKNSKDYLEYLSDINLPILPWETKQELINISELLLKDISNYITYFNENTLEIPTFEYKKIDTLQKNELNIYNDGLRQYRRKLADIINSYESQSTSKIQEYITLLKEIHNSKNKKSIELEKLSTLALVALNDALEIKPNYPVGDDNEPTFTAPANKPDIECFYESFNSICEVTMLTSRDQWFNEGQPVMRHLRDFENSNKIKDTYCLFIAPKLHQDTIETFWFAVKYGYKGARQRIIPLSITQFIRLLESLLEIRNKGIKFTHLELLQLYDDIINKIDTFDNSDEWIRYIPKIISKWQTSILQK
ncbi:MAG: AlwI family type II restriction endonuclease [Armatimonadota bacterium]